MTLTHAALAEKPIKILKFIKNFLLSLNLNYIQFRCCRWKELLFLFHFLSSCSKGRLPFSNRARKDALVLHKK